MITAARGCKPSTTFDTFVIESWHPGDRALYTDSTPLKANATKWNSEVHQVEHISAAYLAEFDAAIDADRVAAGKKPLKRDDDDQAHTPSRR